MPDFSTPLSKDTGVIFLLDSSEEVERNDFKRQREFVISLAKAFKVSENGVRASVITYGKYSRPSVQFKDTTDFDKFLRATMRTSQIRGPRMMDKALEMAVRMFRYHQRPAPKTVLLFTSGPQATDGDQLKGPREQLEKLGARIYVVAIGPSVVYRQVEGLVNSSSDVIQVPSFISLQSKIHAVGRHVSLQQGKLPKFVCARHTPALGEIDRQTDRQTQQSLLNTLCQFLIDYSETRFLMYWIFKYREKRIVFKIKSKLNINE